MRRGTPHNQDILPEIEVKSFDEPPAKISSLFSISFGNAWGYAKAKNFDNHGNWIGREY